jgi:hypothetical protein
MGADTLILLGDLDYVYDVAGTPTIGTARIGSSRFFTAPGDTPSGAKYRDVIKSFSFGREIDRDGFTNITATVNPIVLNNGDGKLGWLLDAIIDGRELRLKVGYASWNISQFIPLCTPLMERAEVNAPGEITLRLRDSGLLLDKALVGAPIGGAGVNANQPGPIALGQISQTLAVLKDIATLRFEWCDPAFAFSASVNEAFSNGDTLYGPAAANNRIANFNEWSADPATDRINRVSGTWAHTVNVNDVIRIVDTSPPAPLVNNQQYWVVATDGTTYFQVSATRGGSAINLTTAGSPGALPQFRIEVQGFFDNFNGTIDLSTNPGSAQITANVSNYNWTGSVDAGNAYDFYYLFVRTIGGISAGNYIGAHASVDPTVSANKLYGVQLSDRRNLTDVMNDFAASSATFYGPTRLGKMMFGQIRTNPLDIGGGASFDTSVQRFTDDSVINRQVKVERLMPQFKRMTGYAALNYPPLTTVAGTVRADVAALDRAPGQVREISAESGTAYATAPSRYHATMIDSPDEMQLLAAGSSGVLDFKRKRLWPHLDVLTCTAPLIIDKPSMTIKVPELGDKVTVYMPRYCGHAADTFWQTLGVGFNFEFSASGTSATVDITALRRRVPDSTTAAHI